MGKKLSHIRDVVVGGGAPPYNDQPIKQEIANLKQKDTQIEQNITQLQQTHNIDKQNLGTRIDNLDRNVAKKNQDNTFRGTQTFTFAKVERVPGNHQHEVINWGVFNSRASRIEDRVTALENAPPGGGGGQPFDPTPLQQEDRRLQQEIDKSNAKIATVEQTANGAEQKATANEQSITTLQQEDTRLDQEINKTNAKVTTVEQTANNANQKATDNEQAISDLEQEDNDIKRRVGVLENRPLGINPGQQNTFTALQTFNAGISANTILVSGTANSDNNVVKHQQIKEYHKLTTTNNTVKEMESWLFRNKPLKYYSYAGNITINNGRARIISNVDSILNLTFAIELGGVLYYGPFDNVAGNKTAVGVLENNVLEIRTINIPNGIYGIKVELLFNGV